MKTLTLVGLILAVGTVLGLALGAFVMLTSSQFVLGITTGLLVAYIVMCIRDILRTPSPRGVS
jgi:hypothetical protein